MKIYIGLLSLVLIGWAPALGNADTVTIPIVEFDDDAEEDLTGPTIGQVRRSSSDLELGNRNLVLQMVGLRFQGVNIPAGAVINSASIQFTANEQDFGSLIIPIYGELSIDPVAFGDATSTTAMPVSVRPLTTATTSWVMDLWDPNPFPSTNDDILYQRPTSPDLSAIVQEMVDQDGWAAGNSMAFILQNDPNVNETSERIAFSYDGKLIDTTNKGFDDPNIQPPMLTIDFTTPAVLLGDVNLDGSIDFLDISPFISVLSTGGNQTEADIDESGVVNFLDISPFIGILSN